jgi:hypothetical protein
MNLPVEGFNTSRFLLLLDIEMKIKLARPLPSSHLGIAITPQIEVKIRSSHDGKYVSDSSFSCPCYARVNGAKSLHIQGGLS